VVNEINKSSTQDALISSSGTWWYDKCSVLLINNDYNIEKTEWKWLLGASKNELFRWLKHQEQIKPF